MTIRYDRGTDGVVVLTLDDPSRGANTMNEAFLAALDTVLDRLEAERADITGVIITSAKQTWFAGGDLDMLGSIGADQAAQAYAAGKRVKDQLRRLETLGRPVVAAINGTVLGGGSNWPSPATTASSPTTAGSRSGSPRSRSACCRAAAAWSARCGSSGSPRRCCRSC